MLIRNLIFVKWSFSNFMGVSQLLLMRLCVMKGHYHSLLLIKSFLLNDELAILTSNIFLLFADQSHLNLFSNRPQTKKKRKSRTAFTNHQIFELEKRFLYQKYLSPADRDEIALSLGLSNAQVGQSSVSVTRLFQFSTVSSCVSIIKSNVY